MFFLQNLKCVTLTSLSYLFLAHNVLALPSSINARLSTEPIPSTSKVPLRILPLGDSITYGYLSSSGNGYRQPLLTLLNNNGSDVQYMGTVRSGNMTDNFNEGHPGLTISQISTFANDSLPEQPNLILLMAGTNDMNEPYQPETAPDRLGALIDQCFSICPQTVVIVAQLTPAVNASTELNIQTFNPEIVTLVQQRASMGVKVSTVNMSAFVTSMDLEDGLHPTDVGYGEMAVAWNDGIQNVYEMGWISQPVSVDGIAS